MCANASLRGPPLIADPRWPLVLRPQSSSYFMVLPHSLGIIASNIRRISSRRSRRSLTVVSPRMGVADLYQLMLSRTEPNAYSNRIARSFPELRE